MNAGLAYLNERRKHICLDRRNDASPQFAYHFGMAKPNADWFLKEWLALLGKKQRDIVDDLDWNKARVSLMIRGDQQYTRDAVNEISTYLNIYPFELLMHPDKAMRLRQYVASAEEVVKIAHDADDEEPTSGPTKLRQVG